jgi:hypothetical protein
MDPADRTAVLAELKDKEGAAIKQVESLLGSLGKSGSQPGVTAAS